MAVTTVATPIDKILTDLNAGWYNTVTAAMRLDQATFVLAQGGLGLSDADSSGLFVMSDSVPPSASVAMFEPAGTSKFSSAYSLLLSALLPETDPDALRNALGDHYAAWTQYRQQYYSDPTKVTDPQLTVFTAWANAFLDPGPAARAIAAFQQAANTPLIHAFNALADAGNKQKFVRSDGSTYDLYTYTATADGARRAINQGPAAQIHYDSTTADTTLHYKTEYGASSGWLSVFGSSSSLVELNQKAASSSFTVDGTIGHYATLPASQGGWFTSAEYNRAYNGKGDNRIWDSGSSAGSWDSFFSQPNGSLARRVNAVVLVSDYKITVTSKASYSQSDFQQIQAHSSGGFWPFPHSSSSITSTRQYQLNADGTLSVTISLPAGDIEIWGVNVLQAPA
jgi:hypothetical protein